mgnify:CR=1 FL=1
MHPCVSIDKTAQVYATEPNIRILITGTLAIDYVATYPRPFQSLPHHAGINMSIHLDDIDRRFGGCAMNIAYNLRLLGHDVVPFVFVGRDYDDGYDEHLETLGIDRSGINRNDAEAFSSHAFIFTDPDGNQFTGFYPGPARSDDFEARLNALLATHFEYAIVAPDVPANMITAAQCMRAADTPFLCDPGQGLTDFSAADCRALVALSEHLIVNTYEHATLTRAAALDDLATIVVTRGEEGSQWMGADVGAERAVPVEHYCDPTGCGDAFRAGWVHATLSGASLRDASRCGATLATVNLESAGSQTHALHDLQSRYERDWSDSPDWLK